jgi:hypothetical protein
VDAVGADQDVSDRIGAVVEHRAHPAAGLFGGGQTLAMLDVDAAAGRLLMQRLVQVSASEGVAGGPVGQGQAGAGPAQVLAGGAAQRSSGGKAAASA